MKASQKDLSACSELIKHGSHSFFMASLLLPRQTAIPATALYAFCRIADDLIDADNAGDAAIQALSSRLDSIYAGNPQAYPEDRALTEVVQHYAIPRAMPDALIEGLAWDTTERTYETLSELYDYAARVAGCVGAMMTLIMRTSDKRAVARACDMGVAMQLTNIYADVLYKRSDSGVALLPLRCRPGIRAARVVYSDIGRQIARQNYETVDKRAIVPKARKSLLLLKSLLTIPLTRSEKRVDALEWPPLIETQYLLEDIESVPSIARTEWLVNLFHDLDERDKNPRQMNHQQTQAATGQTTSDANEKTIAEESQETLILSKD